MAFFGIKWDKKEAEILVLEIRFIWFVCIVYYSVASSTVQPDGIPLLPVVQPDIDVTLTNVPVEETPDTQLLVQLFADISVARLLI